MKYVASLNGVEKSKVVFADDRRGVIVRLVTDVRGHLILNAARTDVERETLRGFVEIRRL